MKRILFILIIAVLFSSCSLLYQLISKAPVDGSIYVMDWEKEAVYRLDSLYNSEMVFNTGAAPSDFIIHNEQFIVSNSGFGGTPSIDIYTMDGVKTDSFLPAAGSSPAGITCDDNYIYTALWDSGELLVLDRETLDEVERLEVPAAWSVLALEGYVYIGTSPYAYTSEYLYTSEIGKWELDSIRTGNNPAYLESDAGRVFVSCVGNSFSGITGSIQRIEGGEVVEKRDFDSYPGKIDVTDEGLFITNSFYQDSLLQYNVQLLNKEDLSTTETYDITSPSDMEQFNDKLIVGTNSGEIYVIELSALTEFISAESDMNLKTGKIEVK